MAGFTLPEEKWGAFSRYSANRQGEEVYDPVGVAQYQISDIK
jgi:hypothetical protein